MPPGEGAGSFSSIVVDDATYGARQAMAEALAALNLEAMAAAAPPSPNPLQLGQVLYAIQDATLIAAPHGSATASYQRVAYTGTFPDVTAHPCEAIALGPLEEIRSARAVTDLVTGKQMALLLNRRGLSAITHDNGTSKLQSVTAKVDDAVLVIDLDPLKPSARSLALLTATGAGFSVVDVDLDSGARSEARQLPPQVKGKAVAAELACHGMSAMLVVVTLTGGALWAHVVSWGDLAPQVDAAKVTSLNLGVASDDAACQAGTAVTRMVKDSSDRQLAVAWADSAASCKLAVVGWDDAGKAKVLAAVVPDIAFAKPDRPCYRLASADLQRTGVEQLVLGYPATYGDVAGCAALLNFSLDTGGKSGPALVRLGHTALANTSCQPLASIDLQLGAGLFGEGVLLGVQVIGGGATASELFHGKASVLCGFVPVDPDTGAFPPLDKKVPALPQAITVLATIDADAPGFFAFPSDLTGQSVVLGAPTLSQAIGRQQILALVQAAPFESSLSGTGPSVTFSRTDDHINGYNVSSNKMWTTSKEAGVNLSLGQLNLGRTMHDTYGTGFDKVNDSSTTSMVQFTITVTQNDWLLLYGMNYNVWHYPVLRPSKKDGADGNLVVIFPQTPAPIQMLVPANSALFGYQPRSEVGMLLSYLEQEKNGYDPDNNLFNSIGYTVTEESGGTQVTFDQQNMNTETVGKQYTAFNSLSDNAHLALSTTLFSFLPASFGLNLGDGSSYSDNEIETTTLTHSTNMSLTFSSGSVKDVEYQYQVIPYVYHHATLGCLMVAYDVMLTGTGWAQKMSWPSVRMIRPYPDTADRVLATFTRSVKFSDNADGSVDIVIELFNNSLKTSTNVQCEVLLGKPALAPDGQTLTLPATSLGTVSVPSINPAGRTIATLKGQRLKPKDVVTVKVSVSGMQQLGCVGWGVYPPDQFSAPA